MKLFTSLLALLAITVTAAPATSSSSDNLLQARDDSGCPRQDDPGFIDAVMRAHWYWRRWHCAQDLVWDSGLADAAAADVQKCDKDATHYRAGSNLDSTGPAPSNYTEWVAFARAGSHGWHDEERLYPYDNPHYDPSWGHFTQMVWRDSSHIGCAMANCGNGVSFPGRLYCYYTNVGNNIAPGQFAKQVWGPVCGDPAASS